MITEDYVSFETAKLLKEKGFDEACPTAYSLIGKTHKVEQRSISNWGKIGQVKRPTLQMAMKWLREVHKLGVFPSTYTNIRGCNTINVYGTAIINLNTDELVTSDYMPRDTYEQACETAIKYCLENLI